MLEWFIAYLIIGTIAINAYSYLVTAPLAEKAAINKVEKENKKLIQTIEKSIPAICPNCGATNDFKSIVCVGCGFELLDEEGASAQKELQEKVKKHVEFYYVLYDVGALSIGGLFAGLFIGPWFGFSVGKLGWPGIISFIVFSFIGFTLVGGTF